MRSLVKRLGLGLCLASSLVAAPRAAEIKLLRMPDPKQVPFIFIRGNISEGDATEFERQIGGIKRGLVVLSSSGGEIDEAFKIGAAINGRGLATMVVDECASACGLIWLSGVRRYFNQGARIGFHAAYVMAFIEGAAVTDPSGRAQRPSYEEKPVKPDTARQNMYSIANATGLHVIALTCKLCYRIDEDLIKQRHKALMTEGEKYGKRFGEALSEVLASRQTNLRQDGHKVVCDQNRVQFQTAGIRDIYLD